MCLWVWLIVLLLPIPPHPILLCLILRLYVVLAYLELLACMHLLV
jgi:hypothetical protein